MFMLTIMKAEAFVGKKGCTGIEVVRKWYEQNEGYLWLHLCVKENEYEPVEEIYVVNAKSGIEADTYDAYVEEVYRERKNTGRLYIRGTMLWQDGVLLLCSTGEMLNWIENEVHMTYAVREQIEGTHVVVPLPLDREAWKSNFAEGEREIQLPVESVVASSVKEEQGVEGVSFTEDNLTVQEDVESEIVPVLEEKPVEEHSTLSRVVEDIDLGF